ncbi:MAG TPA: protein kinase [Steroidobacteraceae bacterium]|nr:protein kinase [Steroidobacteraceae bacterium]
MSTPQDGVPLPTEDSETRTHQLACGGPRTPAATPGSADPAAPSGAAGLCIGERLSGRYRIERELGDGGMGVVYLVSDEQVAGETFAVKLLKGPFDAGSLELLREEVHKTRKLSHPNIVDVHSINVDGSRLYMLMEYLEGKSLRALLSEEFARGMPFSHAWPIIEDVGAALGYAHDHNVIHADLKPENIFVTSAGRTKLLDFGIARVRRRSEPSRGSAPRMLTPGYASCEVLQGRYPDRRDDIYSFACVIYEMLCGELPFGEVDALEARTLATQVSPLRTLTARQNAALAQGLAFAREARPASLEQLLAGLAADGPRGRRLATFSVLGVAALAALTLTYLARVSGWSSQRAVVVQSVASPKSIAVLPFLDLSQGHEQQYLADGLTTALIDRLTLVPGLSVTGQTSSFAVRGSGQDAPTLARRLNVEHLVEGTVRGSAEQLSVSTRLIRAADGFELWSQTFERSGSDILKLEEDIARAVAADLHEDIGETHAPAARTARSLEAYRLKLQADHLWRRDDATDEERALLEAALQRDPTYADAWVDLGQWWYDAMLLGRVVPQTAVPRARAAFDRALALDGRSTLSYVGMAWVQMSQLDWQGARNSIARAVALDPADLSVLSVRGELARSAGHWEEAIRLQRERLQRDPLGVGAMFTLAQSDLCGGDYAGAAQVARQAIAENPNYFGAHALLARALTASGQAASAIDALRLETDESVRLAGLASAQWVLGQRTASDEALAQLRERFGVTLPGLIGLAYAQRQALQSAFPWLQRAVERRQPEFAASLACTPEPAFARLRADPRYAALRRGLGFEP